MLLREGRLNLFAEARPGPKGPRKARRPRGGTGADEGRVPPRPRVSPGGVSFRLLVVSALAPGAIYLDVDLVGVEAEVRGGRQSLG